MRQEDKELLLKDLCARLPYGVIILDRNGVHKLSVDNTEFTDLFAGKCKYIKPYLRSMSSMTEEEMNELKTLCSIYIPTDSPTIGFEEYGIIVFTHHLTNNTYSFKLSVSVIDWLNKNMYDYRGLIPKGLAIEVTKENNPYKNKI